MSPVIAPLVRRCAPCDVLFVVHAPAPGQAESPRSDMAVRHCPFCGGVEIDLVEYAGPPL